MFYHETVVVLAIITLPASCSIISVQLHEKTSCANAINRQLHFLLACRHKLKTSELCLEVKCPGWRPWKEINTSFQHDLPISTFTLVQGTLHFILAYCPLHQSSVPSDDLTRLPALTINNTASFSL